MKKYPVPITVTSLILYIGAAIVFGVIDPSTLARGIIVKIIIVVCLAKSIQAAVAYQREQENTAMQPPQQPGASFGNPMP